MMNRVLAVFHRLAVFLRIALMTPALSDSISFIIFMASMMHRVSPTLTWLPTSTKGFASVKRSIESPYHG